MPNLWIHTFGSHQAQPGLGVMVWAGVPGWLGLDRFGVGRKGPGIVEGAQKRVGSSVAVCLLDASLLTVLGKQAQGSQGMWRISRPMVPARGWWLQLCQVSPARLPVPPAVPAALPPGSGTEHSPAPDVTPAPHTWAPVPWEGGSAAGSALGTQLWECGTVDPAPRDHGPSSRNTG